MKVAGSCWILCDWQAPFSLSPVPLFLVLAYTYSLASIHGNHQFIYLGMEGWELHFCEGNPILCQCGFQEAFWKGTVMDNLQLRGRNHFTESRQESKNFDLEC